MVNKKQITKQLDWSFILLVGLLIVATLLLRLANLGHSNFQGDEIKALCRPGEDQSIMDFLLGQRKGPIQFLITCLFGVFDPTYSSELALRLPFAIAGILSVLVYFLFSTRFFSRSVALYTALLLATNGLFVAFGRIVQYQSITILCTLIALFSFTMATQDEKWKISGLYLGFIAAGIGILGHFDGVYVLFPMVYLLYLWWKRYRAVSDFHVHRNHLLAAAGIFSALLLSFYIPYMFQLSGYQLDYWRYRITGDPSSTWQLFRFYNPGPIIWIYAVFIALGLFCLRINSASILLMIWLLPPLIFNEIVMTNPRTHFYTYLLPLILLAALGIETIRTWQKRLFEGNSDRLVRIMCIVLFGFLMSLSYKILVDHNPEYPWEPKKFLNLELPGGKLSGTFGFPYFREWKKIRGWFMQNHKTDTVVATNEKIIITRFYLPPTMQYKFADREYLKRMDDSDRIIILLIENPQSWRRTFLGLSLEEWKNAVKPVKVFIDNSGKLQGSIYDLTKEEIKKLVQLKRFNTRISIEPLSGGL